MDRESFILRQYLVSMRDVSLKMMLGLLPSAIQLYTDQPMRAKLTVTKIQRIPALYPEGTNNRFAPPTRPNQLCIEVECRPSEDGVYRGQIVVNLDARRIDTHRTSDWLIGDHHGGSGDIGVFAITLPIMIPLLPYVAAMRLYYGRQERRAEMSRHGIALLHALRGQLDPGTEAALALALQHTWQLDRFLKSTVTFAEAKRLLSQHTQHVSLRQLPPDGDPSKDWNCVRQAWWVDAHGAVIAHVNFPGRVNPEIHVLGSTFTPSDAPDLRDLYEMYSERVVDRDNLADAFEDSLTAEFDGTPTA